MQGLSLKNSVEIKHDIDYYHDRLERLFFVGVGEIPGRYDEGSEIIDFFWRDATTATIRDIIFECKRLIYTYEKDLVLEAISAGFFVLNDSSDLLLLIEIECYLRYDPTAKRIFSFTKSRSQEG